jgi:hypothetical protein
MGVFLQDLRPRIDILLSKGLSFSPSSAEEVVDAVHKLTLSKKFTNEEIVNARIRIIGTYVECGIPLRMETFARLVSRFKPPEYRPLWDLFIERECPFDVWSIFGDNGNLDLSNEAIQDFLIFHKFLPISKRKHLH